MRRTRWIWITGAAVLGWLLGCSGLEQLTGGPAPVPATDAVEAPVEPAPAGEEPAPAEPGGEAPAPDEPAAEAPADAGAPVSEACGKPAQELARSGKPKECVQDKVGQVFSYTCPSFDPETVGIIRISGTGPFPTNTSVCYAALYSGKLDAKKGGVVKIKILPARASYPAGEERNHVTTAKWEGSITGFEVVD